MKIRLPASLKERLALRAQGSGRSMNAEIVELIEDALSQYTYEILDTRSPATRSRASEDDLKYEIDQMMARIDVINEDFFYFADRLSNTKGETKHDIFYRQMLIKRLSDIEEERDKLWERVKLIKQFLRRKRASEKKSDLQKKADSD